MSGRKPRRFRPKGKGWRNIFDHGDSAMWLRRNEVHNWDGEDSISCVVYLNWGEDYSARNGIWEIECEPNAGILHTLLDKVSRIYFVEGDPIEVWEGHGVISYTRRPVPAGERRSPKVRGYWSHFNVRLTPRLKPRTLPRWPKYPMLPKRFR